MESAKFSSLSNRPEEDQEWVKHRMELEDREIESAKSKVMDLMNKDILAAKQKLLFESWSRLQSIAVSDPQNSSIYQQMCPGILNIPSSSLPKKKALKKPMLPKMTLSDIRLDLPQSDILSDLSLIPLRNPCPTNIPNAMLLMRTKSGQKWVVQASDAGSGRKQLRYCDGSTSILTEAEARTLGLSFAPFEEGPQKIEKKA